MKCSLMKYQYTCIIVPVHVCMYNYTYMCTILHNMVYQETLMSLNFSEFFLETFR